MILWVMAMGLATSGLAVLSAQAATASHAAPVNAVICHAGNAVSPVVYLVVSPRMPYALKEWARMRRSAEVAGFSVITFRDPHVEDDEWQAAVQAAGVPAARGLPPLQNPALMEAFGALNHFPIALVACGDRAHPWPILGVMPDAPFVEVLRQRLEQLGRDTQ